MEVEADKPLNKLGSHVLLWDTTKQCYYAMTVESLLYTQDQKIKELEGKIEANEKLIEEYKNNSQKAYNEFVSKIEKEKQDFLKTYKETNAKIIGMVKSFVNKEGD